MLQQRTYDTDWIVVNMSGGFVGCASSERCVDLDIEQWQGTPPAITPKEAYTFNGSFQILADDGVYAYPYYSHEPDPLQRLSSMQEWYLLHLPLGDTPVILGDPIAIKDLQATWATTLPTAVAFGDWLDSEAPAYMVGELAYRHTQTAVPKWPLCLSEENLVALAPELLRESRNRSHSILRLN